MATRSHEDAAAFIAKLEEFGKLTKRQAEIERRKRIAILAVSATLLIAFIAAANYIWNG